MDSIRLRTPFPRIAPALALAWALLPAACGGSGDGPSDPGAPPADGISGYDDGGGGGGGPVFTEMDDGHRLYDVLAAFEDLERRGRDADAATRAALWDEILEGTYPAFLEQVIYRKLTGSDRDAYKASVQQAFWTDHAPRLADLRATADAAAAAIRDGRPEFRKIFSDFQPDCDFYLTLAFSFAGKVVDVDGANVLAIGVEAFAPDAPELPITVAHEQFHLHHFRTFSASGGLYRGVWAEGMATMASAAVVPGFRLSQYLGFTGQRMNEIWDAFYDLADQLAANLSNSDAAYKRAWLGVEDNDLGIPPGAGYYLGFHVVEYLQSEGHDLPAMTLWDADTVYGHMQRVLPLIQRAE